MLPQLDPKTWQLETERLILRAPQPGEGSVVNAGVCDSFDALNHWMPWAKTPPTVEESEAVSVKAHEEFRAGTDFSVRLWLKDGTLVGGSGLHRGNRAIPSFEIGYWCRTSFTRQGYTSEAVRALTAFAFESFKAQRLEIRCDSRNIGSRKVAEKCGFAFEAMLRNYVRANDGTLRDMLIFARFP